MSDRDCDVEGLCCAFEGVGGLFFWVMMERLYVSYPKTAWIRKADRQIETNRDV